MGLRPDRKTLSRRLLEHQLKKVLASIRLAERAGHDPVCLDLGGIGRYRSWLPAGRLITVDLDPRHRPRIVGLAEAIPLRSGSVDMVISTEMLEHCAEPKTVAEEAHRVLVDGGVAVFTTPFLYVVHGWPHDYFRFTADGLKHLFRGFSRVEVRPFGNRFVVVYDLVVGFAPFLSSWVNPIIAGFVRNATSGRAPAGHLLVATK